MFDVRRDLEQMTNRLQMDVARVFSDETLFWKHAGTKHPPPNTVLMDRKWGSSTRWQNMSNLLERTLSDASAAGEDFQDKPNGLDFDPTASTDQRRIFFPLKFLERYGKPDPQGNEYLPIRLYNGAIGGYFLPDREMLPWEILQEHPTIVSAGGMVAQSFLNSHTSKARTLQDIVRQLLNALHDLTLHVGKHSEDSNTLWDSVEQMKHATTVELDNLAPPHDEPRVTASNKERDDLRQAQTMVGASSVTTAIDHLMEKGLKDLLPEETPPASSSTTAKHDDAPPYSTSRQLKASTSWFIHLPMHDVLFLDELAAFSDSSKRREFLKRFIPIRLAAATRRLLSFPILVQDTDGVSVIGDFAAKTPDHVVRIMKVHTGITIKRRDVEHCLQTGKPLAYDDGDGGRVDLHLFYMPATVDDPRAWIGETVDKEPTIVAPRILDALFEAPPHNGNVHCKRLGAQWTNEMFFNILGRKLTWFDRVDVSQYGTTNAAERRLQPDDLVFAPALDISRTSHVEEATEVLEYMMYLRDLQRVIKHNAR